MYEKTKKRDQGTFGEESVTASAPVLKSTPGYRSSPVNLELGASRNHTEYFKSIRTFRMERYAAQTNNLLIRLDKLLINLPSDPVKRKGMYLFIKSVNLSIFIKVLNFLQLMSRKLFLG